LMDELMIIVVVPAVWMRLAIWSVGNDSVSTRDTTLPIVSRANAAMIRVHARKDPVSFVTRKAK
jgi:uncharacterized membrane protein YbjE (DUF340 family)